MVQKLIRLTFVLLLCLPFAVHAQEDSSKLALEHYFEMESVSSPQISPDGTQILYTRGWIDKVNDRRRSSVWIMKADGSKNRFLTDGSSARWSPDGARIAFIHGGEPSGRQIFVRWMDAEGATSQITHLDRSPGNLTWSPGGKFLAFNMLVPKPNKWSIKMPKPPRGAKWTETPRIIENFVYRQDRVGFLEGGYRHIFLVTADGGTPRQLTSGDYHHGGVGFFGSGLSFTPDGKNILFSGLRADDWEFRWAESEIYAVNVKSKNIRQITTRKGPDNGPVVSPDGKWVAYTGYDWTAQTYTAFRLYVIGIDGSQARLLTPDLDRSPGGLHWTEDSAGLYFNISDLGTRNLYHVSLAGKVKKITEGNHMLTVSDISRSGHAVGILSSYEQPGDVVSFALANPKPKQLTFVNDDILADIELGETEEIWYDSVDGFRIQGWIVKPPGFDPGKKYPLMLQIHGGPHAMYNVGFSFVRQEHVANGYVLLYTNPRGSTGYGTDFGNAINNAYPSKDYDDLMKGVDEVLSRGYVDERNLFVYGCSGGGVLTSWVVGHTDRFAAASANCPVINWVSFPGTTDISLWSYHRFDQMPWEDPAKLLKHSPITYVGNVKTPTMLMTGIKDMRTPISQTEEFYAALKMLKVPTAMIRFNNEYHGTSRTPSNFLRTQLYLRYWFEKYMTKEE